MQEEQVILVNEEDRETGVMEKLEAHRQGLRHRAFSIFVFNRMGEMLLQQRAQTKYHSAGLWSNACCGHPRPGESLQDAAGRRLSEELGFETELQPLFCFNYRAELENGLVENEIDHVFWGRYDGAVLFNINEAQAVVFMGMEEIEDRLQQRPRDFTYWFRECFPRVKEWMEQQKKKS